MSHENTEAELDLDALQKSLDELVSVADATELHKAYGGTSVEYSGRYDEDGKGGGGGADKGDVGGLDDMMIAKMSDAGIPPNIIGDFLAFMDGDDEEEEEKEEAEKSDPPPVEELQKALDDFKESPNIADAVDVSPFLEDLVGKIAGQFDSIRKSEHDFQGHQGDMNRHLAVALHQIGTLAKSQQVVINELGSRLGLVERQPAAPQPRGATSLHAAQAMTKSMPNELGAGGAELAKSELLSTLTYMNLVKGIKQVNGQPTYELACMYDGGAPVDGRVIETVKTFLATHPHEADQARTYA